jgi:hypothetical protein
MIYFVVHIRFPVGLVLLRGVGIWFFFGFLHEENTGAYEYTESIYKVLWIAADFLVL